jgi:hypothetical protein
MLRKLLTLGVAIEVNINGGGWVAAAAGGSFNTGANTNCGIGANCPENSAIAVQAGGISITGAVAFHHH